MVGLEPPPQRILSSALCNSRARSPIPIFGRVSGPDFKLAPRDRWEEERAERPLFLTVRRFLQTCRTGRRFRALAASPKRKGPPRFWRGGLRGEVPCFLVGWLAGYTPDQGKEGRIFKDEIALGSQMRMENRLGWMEPPLRYRLISGLFHCNRRAWNAVKAEELLKRPFERCSAFSARRWRCTAPFHSYKCVPQNLAFLHRFSLGSGD